MFTVIGRIAVGLSSAGLLALAAAAPAVAASGGAVVSKYENFCQPVDAHLTVCVTAIEIVHETDTGNGGVVYIDNTHGTQTDYVDGALVETDQLKVRSQSMYKNASDAWHEAHLAFHQVTTYPGGAGCTIDQRYHFANGQIQFDAITNTCPQ